MAGLTEEQKEARAALRTRQLLRTSRGETALSSDLNQMADLVAAFDAMVLKAFRDTDDVASMLKSDEFWHEVDELEKKLAEEEDLTRLELKLQMEIDQLEKEMAQEVVHIESIMSDTAVMPEEEIPTMLDLEEEELYIKVPTLRQSILVKRYAKYRVYAKSVAEMQRERNLDPSKSLVFKEEGEGGESGFSSGARALFKRTMAKDHVQKQRQAEREGAFLPPGSRPEDAVNASRLTFVGPVFGHKKPTSVIKQSAGSSLHDSNLQEEEFIPGTRWVPPPMPELRPPAPKMPTRKDLTHASWARPGHTGKNVIDRAKTKFFDMHLPKVNACVLFLVLNFQIALRTSLSMCACMLTARDVCNCRKIRVCPVRRPCQVTCSNHVLGAYWILAHDSAGPS